MVRAPKKPPDFLLQVGCSQQLELLFSRHTAWPHKYEMVTESKDATSAPQPPCRVNRQPAARPPLSVRKWASWRSRVTENSFDPRTCPQHSIQPSAHRREECAPRKQKLLETSGSKHKHCALPPPQLIPMLHTRLLQETKFTVCV